MTTSRIVRNESRTALPSHWFLSAVIGVVLVGVYLFHRVDSSSNRAATATSELYGRLSLAPQFVAEGEVWRLLTANLLHSNIWSLLASLLTLALVGSEVEARWGARRYTATVLIVGLATTLSTMALVPPVSRWATGTAAMLGLVGAALAVARRAGFRIWLIVLVGLVDLIVYVGSAESSIWAAFGALAAGVMVAFLLISAPDDRRRDRVQAMLLGGIFLLLVIAAIVLIASY